ncbi:MAG: BatA domain-containing protein [Planctomycetia bacterium]|nr:BatA domain-containing protein [Planctomycetia bacterium]
MLTFLAPAALFGLSLLAIPIVIHLLKPRKMRRTPFSSLRWLQLTQQKLSRRLRWHQVLLFLLRAAFIALLVAAVAKPIVDRRTTAAPSERFVILDVSRSMGYRASEQPTPLEVGKQAASALLAGGGADDRTALLTVAAKTKILGPLARGGERHAPKLSPVAVESTATDIGSALDTVRTLMARGRTEAKIELFLITDRHQGSCRPEAVEAFVAEFPNRVTATIVDAAAPKAANGWIADAVFLPAQSGEPPAVEVQLRAVGLAQERTVRLVGIAGRDDRSQTITLDPEKQLSVTFKLPADFDSRGKTCELVLDPPDGLPTDDRRHLPFDGGAALEVLIVEGRDRSGNVAAGFTLRTALEALSSSTKPIRVAAKKYNEVEPADFAKVDVVLWADVPQLSDLAMDALAARVRGGLGLGIFLGPDAAIEFYNRRLIDPLDRTKSLLPAQLDRIADVPRSSGGSALLESVEWKHPLLAGLFDPMIGDLAQTRVRSYFRFVAPIGRNATVLASAAGSPLLVQQPVGQGNVVLFNTTADDAWSDLARRKSFVPLLDRLLDELSGGMTKRTFMTGEAIALSMPMPAEGESLKVVTPGGGELVPVLATTGNKTRVSIPPQNEAGIYRIRREGGAASKPDPIETAFVVQVDRADSTLVPVAEELIRTWWEPARCEFTTAAAVIEAPGRDQISLVGWAALLAASLLTIEMFVVHRMCPKMNPQSAESIVRRQSIVSTTRSETSEGSIPAMIRNA